MAKIRGAVVIDMEHCKGCDLCIDACREEVLALSREVNLSGYNYSYMLNPGSCTGCSNCGIICPDSCISVYRIRLQ